MASNAARSGPIRGTIRQPQLAYSEIQRLTYDEKKRRAKAGKVRSVITDFLGQEDLSGLVAADLGCSTGFTASELFRSGATVVGLDIDVPGLAYAERRFGEEVFFMSGDGSALPFPDRSVDIIVFNHIYEHVVDPDAVMTEIKRVLRPEGIVYLGLGNKFGVVEPHYRLPFLSWIPRKAADRYVRLAKRAPEYYERFQSRSALIRMCSGLQVWDYTYAVLRDPARYNAHDVVPGVFDHVPELLWRGLRPIIPTFIWVGTPGDRLPAPGGRRSEPIRVLGSVH